MDTIRVTAPVRWLAAAAFALAFAAVPSAQAVVIDFEDALGADDQTFIAANGNIYKGLDWSNPGDASGASDYQIDTDNVPFASFGGGSKWLQGFAEGNNNRAKVAWDGANTFEFNSIALRTRFTTDAANPVDGGGDGVDDRWLTEVTLRFRDVGNQETLVTVDLAAAGDWVVLDASGVVGSADLTQLKAIFFEGDSGTTVNRVRNDRFAIDNLTVNDRNSAPTPEPGGALLFAVAFGITGFATRRRRS